MGVLRESSLRGIFSHVKAQRVKTSHYPIIDGDGITRSGAGSEMTLPPSLMAALRHLLRPLVRLLVARGITYPMLLDLLKQAYVDVAQRDFPLEGRAPTDSRISLLTGVHRKDVRRLRSAPSARAETMPDSVALGAQLVAAWTGRREFRNANGQPRRLARLASQGGERSFESLVAAISKDIRARSVLDELLRLGVVELDGEDRVMLKSSAFVPSRGFDEKAFYLGHNVHDHLAAATHNLLGEGAPFLERSVHYDALDAQSVARLSVLAEETGMKALQAVNRKAMDYEARAAKDAAAGQRITFGIYFFTEARRGEAEGEEK